MTGHGVTTSSAARAGRMLIAQGAIDACKIGVTIAVRYGCARPQFNGKVVMSYLTHQRRLLPALATTYAMHLLGLRLKVRRASTPKPGRDVYVAPAGDAPWNLLGLHLKPWSPTYAMHLLGCGSRCGGLAQINK